MKRKSRWDVKPNEVSKLILFLKFLVHNLLFISIISVHYAYDGYWLKNFAISNFCLLSGFVI